MGKFSYTILLIRIQVRVHFLAIYKIRLHESSSDGDGVECETYDCMLA